MSKAQGKLTRNAERMLELLAKKTIKKMRYWSNDDKLDCYQSGLLDMFQNWFNFIEVSFLSEELKMKYIELIKMKVTQIEL